MFQHDFANNVVDIIRNDDNIIGLAAAGSWITNEIDDYSDLDLVLVTNQKIGGDKDQMLQMAKTFGDLISAFTGEHVGEPRLLICLYDNPLIHVDIKFLQLAELSKRVEDPVVLFERDNALTTIIKNTKAEWPAPDCQWIEDRIWTWVHYVASKIGRGEYFDCLTSLDFLRAVVLSPLMQLKNKKQPRALRKVETQLSKPDLENLKITVADYDVYSIITSLDNVISIYRSLRRKLFPDTIELRTRAEKEAMAYFKNIKQKIKSLS